MKIVRFNNGKYAVRTGFWSYSFASVDGLSWHCAPDNIWQYCQFETFAEAEQLLNKVSIEHEVVKKPPPEAA